MEARAIVANFVSFCLKSVAQSPKRYEDAAHSQIRELSRDQHCVRTPSLIRGQKNLRKARRLSPMAARIRFR